MAVEELYAAGKSAIVYQNARDDSVIDHLKLSRFHGGFQQVVGRVEECSDIAAAPAGSAVVALRMTVVWVGQDRAAAGHDGDAHLLRRFLQQALSAARRRRRQHIFTTR